jgi:hypothetical protein
MAMHTLPILDKQARLPLLIWCKIKPQKHRLIGVNGVVYRYFNRLWQKAFITTDWQYRVFYAALCDY